MTVEMMQLQLPLWHPCTRHNPGLKRGSGQFKRRHMYFTTPGIFLIPGEKKRPGIERVTPAGGQPFLHVIDAPRKECIIRGEAIDGTSIRAHNVGFVPEICIQHAAHLVLGNVPSDQGPSDDNILYLFSCLPEKGHQDMDVITGDGFDKRSSLCCDLSPEGNKSCVVAI